MDSSNIKKDFGQMCGLASGIQIPHPILLLSLESTSSTGIEIKAADHYAILPYPHANRANSPLKIYKYY